MTTSFPFPLLNPFPPFSSPSPFRRFTSSPFFPHASLLPSPLPLNSHSSTVSSSSSSISLEIFGRRGRRLYHVVKSLSAAQSKSISDDRMLVFVPPHPLIKHWVALLRNEETPCPIFRNAMAELGRLLIYEASRDWLPTITGEIQSPMGVASVELIDPREPVAVVPILRAGLALVEHASSILPSMLTYHLGVSRDEETLQPTVYLNKLPDTFPEGSRVLVVDPMLATGGTIVAALNLLKERGVNSKKIKVISAVAAPPALQKLSENFPGLHVYTGIIDPTVNEKGFIIPGLGDAGDRSFVVEASPITKQAPPVAMAFTVGIRFANNIYRGMQFIDWAKKINQCAMTSSRDGLCIYLNL